jgi:D-amino-acid dehydrogenase
MTSTTEKHTVVIGGGVIGAFTAYYLRKTGRRVTIIDRNQFGAACSHGNCGYVSPSHVLPLCRPGQIANGIKGLFSSQRALRIKPRLSPSFWSWMLKFAIRCNEQDMLKSGAARHSLLQSSAALYPEIVAEEAMQVEWTTDGLLFVFRDQHEFVAYRKTNQLLTDHFGVSADPIEGSDALVEMEPALKPGLAGAWLYRGDAHLRPDRLMAELPRVLLAMGVQIVDGCEFRSFVGNQTVASGIQTAGEIVSADEFIVCTGAWTPFLNSELGCRIPIQPGKGYSITMPRPHVCPRYPMILEECHVGITPFQDGYRIGSTMEFVGYDTELNHTRLNCLRTGAAEYLRDPTAEPVEEEWYGWRPMTWDGLPRLDRSPRFSNVWVAAGHNMLGISMGPATGKLMAELIDGRPPHVDPQPFRIGRS